jgi:hypothetical protein
MQKKVGERKMWTGTCKTGTYPRKSTQIIKMSVFAFFRGELERRLHCYLPFPHLPFQSCGKEDVGKEYGGKEDVSDRTMTAKEHTDHKVHFRLCVLLRSFAANSNGVCGVIFLSNLAEKKTGEKNMGKRRCFGQERYPRRNTRITKKNKKKQCLSLRSLRSFAVNWNR